MCGISDERKELNAKERETERRGSRILERNEVNKISYTFVDAHYALLYNTLVVNDSNIERRQRAETKMNVQQNSVLHFSEMFRFELKCLIIHCGNSTAPHIECH